METFDVLIVGGGLAGLRAAIAVADSTSPGRKLKLAVMTRQAGIFREHAALEDAWIKLKNLKERYQYSFVHTKEPRFNAELRAALELEPMLDVVEIIISCALARQESRGAHKRIDFPDRDDENWLKHSLAQFTLQGTKFDFEPPVITHYQPTERTY